MIDNGKEVLIGNLLKTNMAIVSKQSKEIISMPSNRPVTEAAKLMLKNQVGSIIIKNKEIEGIITKGDIINRVVSRALDPGIVLVDDVMSKPVTFVSEDETLENTMLIMAQENIERILVVEGSDLSQPLGIVSTNDILKFAPGLLRIHRERLLIETIKKMPPNEANRSSIKFQGFCDDCSNYSDNLKTTNGYTLCPACMELQPEEDQSSEDDFM
ncbi:MAG: CBS domain-containing protein [Candidatus Heimdallarchaeota archaeon]|nr:MAG: CBS domain-containing protein [Candidatus Heimdallarchaeota archaeon]